MNRKRVVISGIGAITSIGDSFDEFSKNLFLGKNGVSKLESINTESLPYKYGGEIKTQQDISCLSIKDKRRMDRASILVLKAANEAINQSQLTTPSHDLQNTGVVLGSTLGGMISAGQYYRKLRKKNKVLASRLLDYPLYSAGTHIAQKYNFHGQNLVISTACSSSNIAIGQSADLIRSGLSDVMITGGFDTMSELTWAGFGVLRNVSTDYPRPFDKNRKGMVLGEGVGILVLESYEHCVNRGGPILAEVCGYGMSSDAYHMTAPDITGKGPAMAIDLALKDSGINHNLINYINAHGTGTLHNDAIETHAIKRVFGDYAYKIPVTSIKSMIGHTLGASGALSIIASIASIQNHILAPTINYETPDPKCDLDYVPNTSRKMDVNYALINNFGFGGNNCSVIIGKAQ